MNQLLSFLSEIVPQARTLEQLTRPLLVLLGQATGMESTYLTTIDLERGRQRVEFARNVGAMEIPEGLEVPWDDTLCKRALDEGRTYSDDVAECWGDSDAARALGIRTYVSAPIRAQDGRVLGTVCAASAAQVPRTEEMESMLRVLSGLLGFSLEREVLVGRLQALTTELAQMALTDSLTGLYNRRAILREIPRLLALARRERTFVLIGVVDLDGFKQINDSHGHQPGDQFLCEIAARLQGCLRSDDLLGRSGGDEFVVCALGSAADGPPRAEAMSLAADQLQQRLAAATVGGYPLGNGSDIRYDGASVGVVALLPDGLDADEAIRLADCEMYRVKQERKRTAPLA